MYFKLYNLSRKFSTIINKSFNSPSSYDPVKTYYERRTSYAY